MTKNEFDSLCTVYNSLTEIHDFINYISALNQIMHSFEQSFEEKYAGRKVLCHMSMYLGDGEPYTTSTTCEIKKYNILLGTIEFTVSNGGSYMYFRDGVVELL